MSGNWVDEDDLSCFLLEGEAEIFRATMMNYGVENTTLYGQSGVNTTLNTAGGGDGFISSNYPGQIPPNPNSSSSRNQSIGNLLCPNPTNPNSVGAVQLGGVGQSEPPMENAKDVLPAVKKQRITKEKALRLEASFRDKNKLEPNRKDQLAEELGLDPRQVVIWFQNRRARTKGKELEADYYTLKDKYSSLKLNYDRLFIETQLLRRKASMLHKLRHEKRSNFGYGNGSSRSVAGNGLLLAAPPRWPPREEDPFKGIEPPSMAPVSRLGQPRGDVFDSGFGESFDFMVPAMDDQSTF